MKRGHPLQSQVCIAGNVLNYAVKIMAFMPVVVVAMEQADYDVWKKSKLEQKDTRK